MYLFIYPAIAHARPRANELCILIRTLCESRVCKPMREHPLAIERRRPIMCVISSTDASSREIDLRVNSRVPGPWVHYASFAFGWCKSHIYTTDGRRGRDPERSLVPSGEISPERDSISCAERARNVAARQVYVTGVEEKKGQRETAGTWAEGRGNSARKWVMPRVAGSATLPDRTERCSGANAVINISLAASWRMQ
jgi:hypothetical protein